MRNAWWAKTLRILGIVLMSLTAALTLLGGAGTTCVAINPTGWDGKFAGIAPFQWLWILFVLVGVAAGLLGVRAVIQLVRGRKNAYREALIVLILGSVLNAVHVIASRALRGASMSVDAVLYTNLFTLIVFLLFRIPGLWQGVDYENPAGSKESGGYAAAISLATVGLLTLSIQHLMASTHTIDGVNYAGVWHAWLLPLGISLLVSALAILHSTLRPRSRCAASDLSGKAVRPVEVSG